MNPMQLQQMKLRLAPVAAQVHAQVGDAFNLDALAKLFVQVENINAMTPQLNQAMDYARFMPVKSNFGGVVGTSHSLQRKQGVGEGKPYAGTGGDIPLAEVIFDTVDLKVKEGSIAYQYSVSEIATAMAMGITLEADKIAAARLGFEKHMSKVAWNGEAATGLKGFYNQTGVALSAKTINFKTAAIADVLDFINTVIYDALDAAEYDDSITPTTIILPTAISRDLGGRTVGAGDTPMLKYIRENNEAALEGRTIEIVASKRGNGAGANGSNRIVTYAKDPNCIEMRIPQELQFQPAQPKDLDIYVPGNYLYQGVWLKRVDSMRYYDVTAA